MRLLFGLILSGVKLLCRLIGFVFRFVYGLCKLLHVRLLALYLVVCALVQFIFSPFHGFAVAYFCVGLAACLLVTGYGWARSSRERRKRRRLKREEKKGKEPISPQTREAKVEECVIYPRYFEVEGHPDYTFAEYEDRYELFVREASGYTYVRTDYKKNEETA